MTSAGTTVVGHHALCLPMPIAIRNANQNIKFKLHDGVIRLLAVTVNLPVTVEFPSQRPVTRSVDVFSDLRLNNQDVGDLRLDIITSL